MKKVKEKKLNPKFALINKYTGPHSRASFMYLILDYVQFRSKKPIAITVSSVLSRAVLHGFDEEQSFKWLKTIKDFDKTQFKRGVIEVTLSSNSLEDSLIHSNPPEGVVPPSEEGVKEQKSEPVVFIDKPEGRYIEEQKAELKFPHLTSKNKKSQALTNGDTFDWESLNPLDDNEYSHPSDDTMAPRINSK